MRKMVASRWKAHFNVMSKVYHDFPCPPVRASMSSSDAVNTAAPPQDEAAPPPPPPLDPAPAGDGLKAPLLGPAHHRPRAASSSSSGASKRRRRPPALSVLSSSVFPWWCWNVVLLLSLVLLIPPAVGEEGLEEATATCTFSSLPDPMPSAPTPSPWMTHRVVVGNDEHLLRFHRAQNFTTGVGATRRVGCGKRNAPTVVDWSTWANHNSAHQAELVVSWREGCPFFSFSAPFFQLSALMPH